jgi:HD-GYP domain-containing protein (c-di-GMP phosphodiesterase class II)
MTCDRPYRRALDWGSSCREIVRGSGGQFDPAVVAVFGEIVDELHEICLELAAAA